MSDVSYRLLARATQRMLVAFEEGLMADFTQGYEKISTSDKPPYSAQGTEQTNQEKGPGPEWAKRPAKSDPHTGAKSGT